MKEQKKLTELTAEELKVVTGGGWTKVGNKWVWRGGPGVNWPRPAGKAN
jgi:hypothetical protein